MPAYRIAVLSDIHACLTALEAVLDALRAFEPLDALLAAGDFTYGPNQPATLARLRERGAIAVLGNGDVDLLDFASGRAPVYTKHLKQFSLIRWTREHTTSEALDFLGGLPRQRVIHFSGAAPIRMVHGSPRDVNESLSAERNPGLLGATMAGLAEPVLVFGHTHQPLNLVVDGKLALNPGAVGMAKGAPSTAYFAVMEWPGAGEGWRAALHQVPYSPHALREEFAASGMLENGPLERLLLATSLTGTDVGVEFMRRAYALSAQAGFADLPYLPDEVWEQAARTFDWPGAAGGQEWQIQ